MSNDTMSAAAIRNMTPAEAWEAFVGDQTPVEFVKLGGSTDDYVENAPLCDGLTIAAQSILRIKLDTYIESALNTHAERNPAARMTEADALALHPDAPARNIRAMIAGEDDASCPRCGAPPGPETAHPAAQGPGWVVSVIGTTDQRLEAA